MVCVPIVCLVVVLLSHGVESASVLEPLDLTLVEGVRQRDLDRLAAIGGVDGEGNGLAGGKLGSSDANLVVGANLLVIGRITEGQRKHTLLLQVGLVLCRVSKAVLQILRILTIRAKDRVMTAIPPKCLGSRAACSREEPSP